MILCCILYICKHFLRTTVLESIDGNVHDDPSPSHLLPLPHHISSTRVSLGSARTVPKRSQDRKVCQTSTSPSSTATPLNKTTKKKQIFHKTSDKVIYLNDRMIVYSEEENNVLWLWHYFWGLLLWNNIRWSCRVGAMARSLMWCDSSYAVELRSLKLVNWFAIIIIIINN